MCLVHLMRVALYGLPRHCWVVCCARSRGERRNQDSCIVRLLSLCRLLACERASICLFRFVRLPRLFTSRVLCARRCAVCVVAVGCACACVRVVLCVCACCGVVCVGRAVGVWVCTRTPDLVGVPLVAVAVGWPWLCARTPACRVPLPLLSWG